MSKETPGSRVKRLSKERGYDKQSAFCNAVNDAATAKHPQHISESSMSAYLTDKTPIPQDILILFADFFHVTTDYLLCVSDDPNPYAAEAAQYTGLSPQALHALHSLSESLHGGIIALDHLILSPRFGTVMSQLYLLHHKAMQISNCKPRMLFDTESKGDAFYMHSRREAKLQQAADDLYGTTTILKNIDSIRYEQHRVLEEINRLISDVCETNKAEAIWNKKNREACAEFNARAKRAEKEANKDGKQSK